MKISFTNEEKRIINIWSDNVIHGGHWGDGDVIFPDEQIIIEKILLNKEDEYFDLNLRDIEIILIWSESGSGTPEEEILINKLKKIKEIIN